MKLTIEFYGKLKAEFSPKPLSFNTSRFDISACQTPISIECIYLKICQTYNNTPDTKITKPILNDTFVDWSDSVKDGDVIGFFPPASGG